MKLKILNIVPISVNNAEVSLGPLYVSAALKRAGHISFTYFLDLRKIINFPLLNYNWIIFYLNSFVKEFKPDVVTFSVLSTNFKIADALAKYLKRKFNYHIVFGGMHVIVDWQNLITRGHIDAVCFGEGEFSFVEYLEKYINNKLTDKNDLNIAYKLNGNIVYGKNTLDFPSLDKYPFPDRESLKQYYHNGSLNVANFITGRGCPYNCDYCNAALLNQNRGYLRFSEPENIVEDIVETKEKFEIKTVIFSDETFTLNKKHLFRILELYRDKVKLPFVCQTRVETINDEIAEELSSSGCKSITLGIESGNPIIRKEYLNRKMSDEQVVNAFHILKKYNITTNSFNMIGLPDETEKTIWEGINLNKKAEVDNSYCTVFMPFKGTKIYNWYKNNNLIIGEPTVEYYNSVIIKHPNLSKYQLLFYAWNFNFLVKSEPSIVYLKRLRCFFYLLVLKKFIIRILKIQIKVVLYFGEWIRYKGQAASLLSGLSVL